MGISAIATGLEYTLNGLSMIDDDDRRVMMRQKLFEHVELAENWVSGDHRCKREYPAELINVSISIVFVMKCCYLVRKQMSTV